MSRAGQVALQCPACGRWVEHPCDVADPEPDDQGCHAFTDYVAIEHGELRDN